MAKNQSWLVFAQQESCRHALALSQMGYLCWNPHNRKFELGDTVYLFMSSDRSIRFKTTVTAVGVPRTDQRYWLKPTSGKPICNLTLVEAYGGKELDEYKLMDHGFLGGKSIQQPKKLDGELLDYIEAQFTK